jgi:RHS repeat-associated protein
MTRRSQIIVLLAFGAQSCGGVVGDEAGDSESAVSLGISATNLVGRLVSSGNGPARSFYGYDARGRTIAAQHLRDGHSFVYATGYGFPCGSSSCAAPTAAANGSVVISETFPDKEVVRYTFDVGGAEQSITSTPSGGATQTIVKRVLRNARGQTTLVDYGDTTTTTHHYNDTTNLRLAQFETFLTAAPSSILQLYTYAFDGNGNVTGINDYCNEASTGDCSGSTAKSTYTASYQYDARGQLVATTRNGVGYGYAYDGLGNLTNKEGVAQSYFPSGAGQPHPHALSAVGAVRYAYDPNGNLTGSSGAASNIAITWNADDMPVSASYGAGGANTTKAFIGESMWRKRLKKSTADAGVTTYYLPSMHVFGPSLARRKYYGAFAERNPSNTSCGVNAAVGCLEFYHGDHLGSSTLVTSAAGVVVHRQSYKPFGEDLVSPAVGSFTPERQFNFKEKEQDGSGLYDYGARMYNPATGRFLSADISDADGLNRYAYVRNNPLTLSDPTGHASETWEAVKDFVRGWWHSNSAPDLEDRLTMASTELMASVVTDPKLKQVARTSAQGMHEFEGWHNEVSRNGSPAFQAGELLGPMVQAGATFGAVALSGKGSGPKSPRQIAREGERWARNRKFGTCATAAMGNAVSATIEGYSNVRIVRTQGEVKTYDGLFSRARTEHSSHAVAQFEDGFGKTHTLSWGKDYGSVSDPVGFMNSRQRTFTLRDYVDRYPEPFPLPPSNRR